MRERALDAGETWLPEGVDDPRGPVERDADRRLRRSCVFAQWAVYVGPARRPVHAGLALGLVGLMALAFINAQAYVYSTDGAADRRRAATPAMFYAITGTMLVLVVIGLGVHRRHRVPRPRRPHRDREIVAAHALYWYFARRGLLGGVVRRVRDEVS